MNTPRFFLRILVLLALTLHVSAQADDDARPVWEKVVVFGASASAGFTIEAPFGGAKALQHSLSRHLGAAIIPKHDEPVNFGSNFLFMNVEQFAPIQIENTRAANPTLAVAIDFLFWHCYGSKLDDDGRLALFEVGLKRLETFTCLLIVGNVPNASAAAGGILNHAQVPPKEIIVRVNARLREWAQTRPNVAIVGLAEFMDTAMANKAITVREHTWPDGNTRALLQADKLHPSRHGVSALAMTIFDAALKLRPQTPVTDFCWEPGEIFTRAMGK